MHALRISAIAIALTATFVHAAPHAELPRLIAQLGSRNLAEREAAEARLIELGSEIIDDLPLATPTMTAEVTQRLNRVRLTVEKQRAEAFVQGSRVTLSAKNMPVRQAIEKLAEQTKNRVFDFRTEFGQEPNDPPISIELDKVLFWDSLDQILDLAGLTVYPFSGQPGIALVNRAPNEAPRHSLCDYAGAFRISPLYVLARRDLRHVDRTTLAVGIEVAWEPRLSPVGLKQQIDKIKIVDEHDQPMKVSIGGAEIEALINNGATNTEFEIPLVPVGRDVHKIARFSGELDLMVPGRIETFTFDNLATAKKVEKHQAGAHVIIDEVRRNNDLWEVRMRVRFDRASGALESHRTWVFDNEAYLMSADNQRREHDGYQTTLQNEEEIGVAYLFELPEGPAGFTFTYKTPALILALPVPFELRDLLLP